MNIDVLAYILCLNGFVQICYDCEMHTGVIWIGDGVASAVCSQL